MLWLFAARRPATMQDTSSTQLERNLSMQLMNVEIAGMAHSLGPVQETDSDLRRDNPDWDLEKIKSKTGVHIRRIAKPGQTAADLAVEAAEKVFDQGELRRDHVDLVVFVSQSPDFALPTTACLIQDRLGLPASCQAFDINLGCSGFVYGLSVVGALIQTGMAKNALLLCADTYSKYIDTHDRTCRPIFSDGAAATWLRPANKPAIGPFSMGTDGSGGLHLVVPQSGARIDSGKPCQLYMNGGKVFIFSVERVPRAVNSVLDQANLTLDDIDLFVFHQASKVVLDKLVDKIGIPEDKFYVNYRDIGNTVSATIPIALEQAVEAGKLKPGMTVLVAGFGVGLSWGVCLIRW